MEKDDFSIFKYLADQNDHIVFAYRIDKQHICYLNDAFRQITHLDIGQVLNNTRLLFDIIHSEDFEYVKKSFQEALKKTPTTPVKFRIICPDKKEKWISLTFYPLLRADQSYLCGTARDDTTRQISLQHLQQINAWKDTMLEIVSHDLRGPIGTTKLLASIIANKVPDNKEVIKLTGMIQDIAKRNLDLIRLLLNRESLGTVYESLRRGHVEIVQCIRKIIDTYRESHIGRKFIQTSAETEIYTEIDGSKFLRIIDSLLYNAIQFTSEGDQIHIHTQQLEDSFLMTVTDDGIGIPKNLQPFLFTKYTRNQAEELGLEKWGELGLWVTKSLVDLHGGSIWFESETGNGSIFYVKIPF
ncbi:PAS domain-containing sensor histidine kinase [Sphingobacterium pedocola]|uniref:histidine kinase n=1 Tax=Sphingobacterium pedocola TaxID=2082722 RepID=A0ABR9TCI7_9SPHI|nr:PAS domain-containing sensor histidine kinase [Sphingobacterium pedocola]MBE8723060.1 hypothetical protein [Sphingobacterium pedocola]